jgi:RHS repeat-associated protein
MMNSSGTALNEIELSSWGVATGQGSSETPLRFQGHYYDAETDLHYNRWRYYDPSVGRFISTDPIGLDGGPNPFRAPRNFFSWIEPFGLAEQGRGPVNIASRGTTSIVGHGTADVDRPAHAH